VFGWRERGAVSTVTNIYVYVGAAHCSIFIQTVISVVKW